MSPDDIRRRVRAKLEQQRGLVEELLRRREQLAGSLFIRYGVCGKEACICRSGRKHGPYYVLSTRSGGHGGFTYLDSSQLPEARALVKAFREYRAGMRRLRRIGEQIVTLLRRYQELTTRQGRRRVDVGAHPHA